jgi:hypothetical protein
MKPSEFVNEFEKEYCVKVNTVTDHERYGQIFSWKPEFHITGKYPTEIYELQKMALKEEIPMWAEGCDLLLSEKGLRELFNLIKAEWGVDGK